VSGLGLLAHRKVGQPVPKNWAKPSTLWRGSLDSLSRKAQPPRSELIENFPLTSGSKITDRKAAPGIEISVSTLVTSPRIA
jgi:hypothetical protein